MNIATGLDGKSDGKILHEDLNAPLALSASSSYYLPTFTL